MVLGVIKLRNDAMINYYSASSRTLRYATGVKVSAIMMYMDVYYRYDGFN